MTQKSGKNEQSSSESNILKPSSQTKSNAEPKATKQAKEADKSAKNKENNKNKSKKSKEERKEDVADGKLKDEELVKAEVWLTFTVFIPIFPRYATFAGETAASS